MATVGEQLTAPETGWTRYDDRNANITYIGTGWGTQEIAGQYNTTITYITEGTSVAAINASSVRFNFTGTSIRFIQSKYLQHSKTVSYKIDGELAGTANLYNDTVIRQILAFEKTGLVNQEHFVEIYSGDGIRFDFDAIDIDAAGELKPYAPIDAPTNLVATAGDSKVSLTWTAVSAATSYNVKRSTTAGGTYTTIANNVTDASYVDTSVTNGTTYYYVVTVVNSAGESNTSNEASATPVASSDSLLQITMNDSSEREYKVTQIEVDNFIKWINSTGRTGDNCYKFDDVIDSSTEYLIFEKIISFKVIPVGK